MMQPEYGFKPILFNELPNFSKWPERLLFPELLQLKPKTTEEVTREFEHEKWGKLLEQVPYASDVNVKKLEELSSDFSSKIPCIKIIFLGISYRRISSVIKNKNSYW